MIKIGGHGAEALAVHGGVCAVALHHIAGNAVAVLQRGVERYGQRVERRAIVTDFSNGGGVDLNPQILDGGEGEHSWVPWQKPIHQSC